jgi:hypothetical protein
MLPMRALICSIAVASVAPAVAAVAQSGAVVVDQRMIMETVAGKTDTVLSRTVTSKERYRVDYISSTAPAAPIFRPGLTELMMTRDSDMTIIFMDSARKIYAEMKPSSIMSSAGFAGVAMKFESTGDSATMDSIGPGPTIAGHKTLHFRMHSSSRMTTTMFGDTSVRATAVTTDFYVAPDLASDSQEPDSARAKSTSARLRSMTRAMPGAEAMAEQIAKVTKRLARCGTTLKTVTETTATTAAGARTQHMSLETLTYENKVVSNSLFSIPGGYKKVGLMDLVAPF